MINESYKEGTKSNNSLFHTRNANTLYCVHELIS